MSDYNAIQSLNWSRLRLLGKSPAHFKQGFGDDSSGFALGTAAHMATLEPERFAAECVVYPGRRQGKAWEAFELEQLDAGKSIITQKEYDTAIAIRDAVRNHAPAMAHLRDGLAEQTIQWDFAGGFKCKGRADYIGASIVDLKSTKDASPRAFAAACARYGYFGQAAWYSDGLYRATGVRKPFVIVAVESSPPHIVQVYRIAGAALEHGRNQYIELLARLDYCQRENFWGGYSQEAELDLEVPSWSVSQEETE